MGLRGTMDENPTRKGIEPVAVHQLQELSAKDYDSKAPTLPTGTAVGVLLPTDAIALFWSVCILIFDFFYLGFVLPIFIGFVSNNTSTNGEGCEWARNFHWLAGAIYLVDMVFKLNTGVVVAGPGRRTLVTDRVYIITRYLLSGELIIDAIAVLPSFFYEIAAVRNVIGDEADQILSILRLLRLYYVIKISIWLYMKSLSSFLSNASSQNCTPKMWMPVSWIGLMEKAALSLDCIPNLALLCINMMYTILAILNLMACALFAIARWEGEENSWVQGRANAVDDGYHIDTPLIDAGQSRKYLDSVFWAMDTWTTVGFGNPAPVTWVEQIMVLIIEYLYIFFFSLTAALFGNVLSKVHESQSPAEFREKMGKIAAFLDSRKLSFNLRMKVKSFYLGMWTNYKDFQADELLSEVPSEVQEELLKLKALPIVNECSFLSKMDADVRERIALKLVPRTVAAGDALFYEGTSADSLFIIERGQICVTSCSASTHKLGEGEVVGLASLLAEKCELLSKRQTTPFAMRTSTFWELKIDDLPPSIDMSGSAWAYISGNYNSLAIETGLFSVENRKMVGDVDIAGNDFDEFMTNALKNRPATQVLDNEPFVEGMYNPSDLGIYQPSCRQIRVKTDAWTRHVDHAHDVKREAKALIDPTSRLSVCWSWFLAVFDLIFVVVILPPIIQFVVDNKGEFPNGGDIEENHGWGRALLWIAGVIYFLEMVSGFITGFAYTHSNKGLVVMDLKKTLFQYMTIGGGFWIDLLSVIPFIYEIFNVHDVAGDRADQILNIIRLFARYVRVYWILQEIYIHSVINHWSVPTYPFFDRAQPTFVYFGYVIYTLHGVITWIGAMMYVVARWRGLEESWIGLRIHLPQRVPGEIEEGADCINCYTLYEGDQDQGPSEWEHYLCGIFYGIDVLLTNGNGEPHPVTWQEEIVALIVMVFQIYYFGFVLGATLDLFKSSRNIVENAERNRLKMKSMESFFLTRKLPKRLKAVVQSFYTEVWSRMVEFDEKEILDGLPKELRQQVAYEILAPLYKKTELFEGFPRGVLQTMSGLLQPDIAAKDTMIYAESSPSSLLYILESGTMVAEQDEIPVAKLQGPCTFGEELICGDLEQVPVREYSLLTKSTCFLWSLTTSQLEALELLHPGFIEKLRGLLDNMQNGASEVNMPGDLTKRTSSLYRIMAREGTAVAGPMDTDDLLPPQAYQPRTFDVDATEWFRLMSVPESERMSPVTINPHSFTALIISWFMFVFDATYTAFVMPALIAFTTERTSDMLPEWAFAIEIVAGVIFICSMVANLLTGYIAQYDHRSLVVMRRSDVLKNYLIRGGFWMDVVSVVPFFYEVISRGMGGSGEEGETAREVLIGLRMLRLIRVFRVLQLIWRVSFSVDTRQLGWMLRAPKGLGKVLKAPTLLWVFNVFYVFMFSSNFVGVVLYMVGKVEGTDVPGDRSWIAMRWLPTEDGQLLQDDRRILRYLHSVYWAMDTLTTVGFGDPWPNTWEEELVCMLAMFVAVLLFSVVFASTSTVVKALREDVRRLDKLRTQKRDALTWMTNRGFSSVLKAEVQSYFVEKMSADSSFDAEILSDMPSGIRVSLLQHITQGVMCKLDLFKGLSEPRKEALAGLLTPVPLAAGHELCYTNDTPSGLYILEAGTLVALRTEIEVGRVSGPATVGDSALVAPHQAHSVTVRADGNCYLWKLELADLRTLCSEDNGLQSALVGRNQQIMSTAWARSEGGFHSSGSGMEKVAKATPKLSDMKYNYSLRNVVRYHAVTSAKWGALSENAQDVTGVEESDKHKSVLIGSSSGVQVPFSPDGHVAIGWSAVIMCFDATYTSFILPVVLAFGLGKDITQGPRELQVLTWVHVMEWIAGIVFIINMGMNLLTGFVAQKGNEVVIVRDIRHVLVRYILSGTVVVDLLSIVPFLMYLGILGGDTSVDAKIAFTWLLMMRFVPRFVIFLWDLSSTCFAGNNAFPFLMEYVGSSTFYFLLTVYVTAVTLNVFGCFYFFSAVWRRTRITDSWVSNRPVTLDDDRLINTSSGRQYLDAIYWCSDTLTTVGYGDPQPTTWEEMIVAMFIMVFNIYFFILIESAISELLRDTAEKEEFRKHKAAKTNWMLDLMTSWGVNPGTQHRVLESYADIWSKGTGFNEDDLQKELPASIKLQIAAELKQ